MMTITLTDQQVNEIRSTSRQINPNADFIQLIKELRAVTGMGLYEAKTVAEIIRAILGSGKQLKDLASITVAYEVRSETLRNLSKIALALFPPVPPFPGEDGHPTLDSTEVS